MTVDNGLTSNYFASLLGLDVVSVEPMDGGGNSRVLKVTATDGSRFAAKVYPGPTADGQDRLAVEFTALKFLRKHGVECVPKSVVSDAGKQCAVFEYIKGSKIALQGATQEDINQATRFLARLDDIKNDSEARRLPNASEACFSVQAIIDNLGSRLARLEGTEASDFLTSEFTPVFKSTVNWCKAKTAEAGKSTDIELALKNRTLSPSDFGFHNAIRNANGDLVFLDFEYFGWDDPAKMVSDFLLHPAMDLSPALKASFVTNLTGDDPALMERLETVFPLFGLKWCLILLNAFLPQYRLQRSFDDSGLAGTLERQLEKSRLMLSNVEREYDRFPYRDEEHTVNVA